MSLFCAHVSDIIYARYLRTGDLTERMGVIAPMNNPFSLWHFLSIMNLPRDMRCANILLSSVPAPMTPYPESLQAAVHSQQPRVLWIYPRIFQSAGGLLDIIPITPRTLHCSAACHFV